MNENPLLVGLCPTYKRESRLVANAIACFKNQQYANRQLLVYDDFGDLGGQTGDRWEIVSTDKRCESLPSKYNAMVALAIDKWPAVDAFVVHEDDDIELSHHYSNHALALENHPWSHPSKVWSLYTNKLEQEEARGRLHASLAMRREVARWPDTKEAQFDLRLLAELRREHGDPGDPCDYGLPTYVFRWGSTGAPHGQNFMHDGPTDVEWYARAGREIPIPERDGPIVPKLDEETQRVYAEIAAMTKADES